MDRFYGNSTCSASIVNLARNEEYITHETISEYVQSINILENITCIQISTCRRYLSTFFQNSDIMCEFCQNEHNIIEYTITFNPDYQKKIGIYIGNLPIELADAKMRQFLNNCVTLIGNT